MILAGVIMLEREDEVEREVPERVRAAWEDEDWVGGGRGAGEEEDE